MTHPLQLRLRLVAVLFAALGGTDAHAQIVRPDYSHNPEILARSAVQVRADKLYVKARRLLDTGDDAGAEREAERSLLILEELSSESDRRGVAVLSERILAEVYVRRRRFAEALKMSQGEGGMDARSYAVKAVALASLGRLDEARASLDESMKMGSFAVSLVGERADLPAARDNSANALVATAWLVHACEAKFMSAIPLARKGFEAALALAPRNPIVALNAARFYDEELKRPDLAQKALSRAVGGAKATRDLIAAERTAADAAAKIGAAKTSQAP